MRAVMAHNEETSGGSSQQDPSEGNKEPRGNVQQVEADKDGEPDATDRKHCKVRTDLRITDLGVKQKNTSKISLGSTANTSLRVLGSGAYPGDTCWSFPPDFERRTVDMVRSVEIAKAIDKSDKYECTGLVPKFTDNYLN